MIKAIILYFQFFTAIPLPIAIDEPETRFREGIVWFSLAAFLYSLIIGVSFGFLRMFFSVATSLVILAFVDVALTNGFHFDALADMADGIFSGQNKERMLEIMKDSRVGSNGLLALIFYFLFYIFVGSDLITQFDTLPEEVGFMISLYLTGRGAMSYSFHNFKYHSHSKRGLGAILTGISTRKIILAQIIIGALIGVFSGISGVVAFILVLGLTEVYRRLIFRKIGGFNGDTTGAVCLLAQIAYLLLMTVLLRLL